MTALVNVDELPRLALFAGCDPTELTQVHRSITATLSLIEGDVLCREGEVADRWWVIQEGLADVTVGGLYVGTVGPGESVGELAMLDGEPRNATVVATSDMIVQEVDGHDFIDALIASPKLTVSLLRQIAGRLRSADANIAYRSTAPETSAMPKAAAPLVASEVGAGAAFDPFAPGYFDDPYPQLAAIRANESVHYCDTMGAFLVMRYEDVFALSRDRSVMVSIDHATSTPAVEAERALIAASGGFADRSMLRRDGDDHARLRHLVSKVFTPRAIASWKQRAETIVEGLLDAAAQRDEIDVMRDYAMLLPAQIISEMLGMPHSDIPMLRGWSHAITKTLDPINTPDEEAASVAASEAMVGYLHQVIEDKRAHPQDDILSAMIAAEESGDRLSADELLAQTFLLYIAGHETTLNLVGNGLTHLFAHPAQLDRLRSDNECDANAIEELLRFDSPVQFSRRITAAAIEIGGTTVPSGSVVLLALASANRDERRWGATADLLDLGRKGANEHVSFGGGAHYCLGASLARMEGQIALPRLVRRFPRMTAASASPAWGARMILRGVETLPVALR